MRSQTRPAHPEQGSHIPKSEISRKLHRQIVTSAVLIFLDLVYLVCFIGTYELKPYVTGNMCKCKSH